MNISSLSKSAKTRIVILFLSAVLVACMVQGEYLLMPLPLGELGWWLYRIAFCVVLPPRVVVMVFFPQNAEHFWPVGHWVALAAIMPLYLELLRLAGRRFNRRYALRPRLTAARGRLERMSRSKHPAPAAAPAPLAGIPHSIPKNVARRGLEPVANPSRRHFLLGTAAGSLSVATGGVGGYAALVEPEKMKIREYTIPIKDLPSEFNGLRLIHVSDTHYGPFVTMKTLERAVRTINALKGDVIVLTGDYMHRTKRSLKPGIGVLGGLKARLGVVAVLGNHDHWEGTRDCYRAFDGIKVPLLDNRHLYLTPEGIAHGGRHPEGRTLCLAGVGDLWEDEVSFRKSLAGVPERMPRVMLAHNPDVAEMIDPELRVDLMLSGHTHGGQIALPLVGPPKVGEYGYKYLGGLCPGPACPVIVSRGVGMSGLPLRLNVPPEVGVITLAGA